MTDQIDATFNDEAMNAEPPKPVYFGQMSVDGYVCKLVKGTGKVLWDPVADAGTPKFHTVRMSLTPVDSSRYNDPIVRDFLTESKEWTSTIRPSLLGLALDLRSLNGRWVQVEMIKVGSYKNSAGEDRDRTQFRFVRAFATQQECEAAADSFFGSANPTTTESAPAATSGANGTAVPPQGTTVNPQRAMLAKFLKPLWQSSNGDPTVFMQKIAASPHLAAHFNEESKEVADLVLGGS